MNAQHYETLRYETRGPIARIWLNRPEVRNAQSRQLLGELDEALVRAQADNDIRVVVLAGTGAHFSAGHDLKNARAERPNPTVEERWAYEEQYFYAGCMRLFDLTKPTIAQVQGACIAGAFMLANACDLIVCADDAFFSDPVAHSLGTAGLEVLIHPWVMGMRKAKELLFTGRRMSADEARDIGMVNQVVPRDALDEVAMTLAGQIAAAPPFGMQLLKRSLNRTWDAQGLRVALSAHFDAHQLSHVSDEFQRKLKAGLDTTIKATREVGR